MREVSRGQQPRLTVRHSQQGQQVLPSEEEYVTERVAKVLAGWMAPADCTSWTPGAQDYARKVG